MSLVKAVVKDSFVSNRKGTSKAGNPFDINAQENIFIELNGEVRRLPINLQQNQSAYAPGEYGIDLSKYVTVGRYGLEIVPFANIQLEPLKVAETKPLFANVK
jgi:hypothetical protein